MKLHRRRRGNVALIPNQWSGSVQQYYHFLLGYLAPILLWTEKSKPDAVTVRDCGPMNRWFSLIPSEIRVDVMNVGHFLHVYSGRLQPCVVLRGLDFPNEFDASKLQRFRVLVLTRLNLLDSKPVGVTVIDRTVTDNFYFTVESEIDLAGAARRSTPNLKLWSESLRIDQPLIYTDLTELDVLEQVRIASRTRVLIGQHGAGLTNMVFMASGGVIVEIHPPLPIEAVDTFQLLAAACGHRYFRVIQESVHANVSTEELSEILRLNT